MIAIIVSLVLGGGICVLLSKIPRENKTPFWGISSLALILSIAVSASAIPYPHILFSSYIKIDNCYLNQYNLVEIKTRKSRTTFEVLEDTVPKSIPVEGRLGYWENSAPDSSAWNGEKITIIQCPYWGYKSLANMVAHISVGDKVIFNYRSKSEYTELQNQSRFLSLIVFPLSIILFTLLQLYALCRSADQTSV